MTNKGKSVLVIFGGEPPKKNKEWLGQFDKVLGPEEIGQLVGSGSVREACQIISKLSQLVFSDGSKISKFINYQGYELWWMNYDALFEKFCIPYTKYRNLLLYLKDFKEVYLFQPSWPDLFRYFLESYGSRCHILGNFSFKKIMPVPLGIFIQFVLSMAFLPWLMVSRPRLMVLTGDKFDPPNDYDFRMKFIYEEVRKRKIPFVEFIRSLESWPVIFQHAWKRKRPVFYSTAVIEILQYFTRGLKESLPSFSSPDPEERFLFSVAAHAVSRVRGSILSIKLFKFILQLIGVRAAYATVGTSRIFHEVLACKLQGIKTVGIMHGATYQYHDVYDFMAGFDGEKTLSVDRYGLWSDWWKDYYAQNSSAYRKDQLFVSGPMRPLKRTESLQNQPFRDFLRVLYISEEAAVPEEILPYILTLLEAKDIKLYFKFRPYRDGFELWLKKNRPEVYNNILETAQVLRGTIEEAINLCDVVVGSNSTAVLEGLLQLKPFIYFLTNKWGEHPAVKAAGLNFCFAQTPQSLLEHIRRSQEISREDLKKLQEQFFGNPYQNGSKWVVEQIEDFLEPFKQKQG